MTISGTEEGWVEASNPNDSRHSQKQRDLHAFTDKLIATRQREKDSHERAMDTDYMDAAIDVATKMRGDTRFGYSRAYARKFDSVFKGDN